MAGAYLGAGEPEAVVNIGVSGPGVVCSALRRRLAMEEHLTLGDLAEEIKITSFRVTRVGELIGREVAAELGVAFGIVDLSLAPTPTVGDSVGEILKTLGIAAIGAPGSTAAVAMLNDAVKKGGLFASSSVGGLSGAFIPVSEDAALAEAVGRGHLVLEKLEAMTSVCSVGLDMIAIPGDTPRGNDRRHHRRRDGHRRDQRQDDGRAADSRARGQGRRDRRFRRAVRLDARDGGPQQRGQRRLRPLRRPDPGADAVAAELMNVD